ncbi:MAG TPA: DUF411 domain-containing protein [Candidatus Nanoarchaeia archaeon]|nr:DUF411 domain-containing protein [Candidatus Nanoarchaeia archaeon]
MKKIILLMLIGAMVIIAGCSSKSQVTGDAVIYKSISCGCCGVYSDYMKARSSFNVAIDNSFDVSAIKEKYGVPSNLQSCHTTIMDKYFVEGHIPLEAIDKLMMDKPDIKGIAMPGMPSGAPGMPGTKSEPFIIYAVNNDGTYFEFMRM